MKVIGDRVMVALPPDVNEVTTASGLVLVSDPDKFQTPTRGIVVALGEKTGTVDIEEAIAALTDPTNDFVYGGIIVDGVVADIKSVLRSLRPAPFDVQVGDCVIFPRFVGEEIEQDGIRYVILREHEIIGIVEPVQKDTAA